jgi:hypothetical protein
LLFKYIDYRVENLWKLENFPFSSWFKYTLPNMLYHRVDIYQAM